MPRLLSPRAREVALVVAQKAIRGWQLIEAGGGWLLGLGGVGVSAVMLGKEHDFLVGSQVVSPATGPLRPFCVFALILSVILMGSGRRHVRDWFRPSENKG
jgi:hypothetical protein